MYGLVTFGEIMLRLSPPHGERLFQSNAFSACFGGSEANVAVLAARLGVRSAFVTKVPEGDAGDAALAALAKNGVDPSRSLRGGERLGIYYYENGAGLRPGKCVYDRRHSAFAEALPSEYDFDAILDGADAFFLSGITPALSDGAFKASLAAVRTAKAKGATVYFDLNYRSKLWSEAQAAKRIGELLPSVDVFISNLYQANDVLALGVDVSDESAACVAAAGALFAKYPFRAVALTVRRTFSASRNGFFAVLCDKNGADFSERYETDVVDRVGSGDAFDGALIAALASGEPGKNAVNYAAAAAALKHSVRGAFALLTDAEIRSLADGASARTLR